MDGDSRSRDEQRLDQTSGCCSTTDARLTGMWAATAGDDLVRRDAANRTEREPHRLQAEPDGVR